jgi:threonine dehydratase
MRCVSVHLAGEAVAPDRAALEAVRHISQRFPGARVREVPMVRAAELDQRADPSGATSIWLALEALQVTGSFQVRGALVGVASALSWRVRHVVAPSVGNHGIAIAYAANLLDVSATVVVPRTTPRTKLEKIARYGAELVVAPSDRYEVADALARELATARGAKLISPSEDVDVVLGNGASLGFEIVRGLGGVPARVLAPFDGGLATGLAWAFAAEGANSHLPRPVWGVQSEAWSPMATFLERGAGFQKLDECAPSLAEELAATVSPDAFERARTAIAGIGVVPEAHIASSMAHAYQDMGLVLEGTGAIALAPVLFGLPERLRGGDLVVVLTGRNVDPDRLDAVLAQARL